MTALRTSGMGRITLLTDFGTRDGYVAAMKGVMATLAPGVPLDDVSHSLPQGDVRGGCWALGRYWRRYPRGTVHLAVVDPGVGSERKVLVLEAEGRLVVAPDNGLVTRVLETASTWSAVEALDESYFGPERSQTFHGRDIFAPLAAHLALGTELDELGPALQDPVRVDEPLPVRSSGGLVGEVVAVDHFGNLITNIPVSELEELSGPVAVELAGASLPLSRTYAAVEAGEPLALVNSSRRLEIAVRDGSAARHLRGGRGMKVEVTSTSGPDQP